MIGLPSKGLMMDGHPEAAPSTVIAEALLMSAQAECLLLDLVELKQQVEATLRLLRATKEATR
jgi:hypothetical protein